MGRELCQHWFSGQGQPACSFAYIVFLFRRHREVKLQ